MLGFCNRRFFHGLRAERIPEAALRRIKTFASFAYFRLMYGSKKVHSCEFTKRHFSQKPTVQRLFFEALGELDACPLSKRRQRRRMPCARIIDMNSDSSGSIRARKAAPVRQRHLRLPRKPDWPVVTPAPASSRPSACEVDWVVDLRQRSRCPKKKPGGELRKPATPRMAAPVKVSPDLPLHVKRCPSWHDQWTPVRFNLALLALELGEQHLPFGAIDADQSPRLRIGSNPLAGEG
jgi:hypothetical protein